MTSLTEPRRQPARSSHESGRADAARAGGGILGTARRFVAAAGVHEVLLLAALWIAYSASRLIASDDLAQARARAVDILHLEQLLHIDVEHWLNHALTPITQVAVPMSFWYATLHYLVTPLVLAYLFFRQRPEYRRGRNALVIGSALGLICYMLIPTAPPRLMPDGRYLDALALTTQFGWWSGQASAPAGLGHMTNELAAMPSLHVGWTIWVAWAVWQHTNVAGRALAVFYAAGTTVIVIATGNHWVLDAVAGAAVVAAGIAVASWWDSHRRGSAPASS
ncbi:phosphatase PAP2 family protein [Aeromicrobium sp. UC242_57]|uniref:phosphatase PAP2 family protein n=1 Tax=Aeromicrobium sp. UC242_57 TaxID=3374624 RepID=UPI0037B5996E